MRDMREGINKTINNYEEHGIPVALTEREKGLIEYGYVQCALQVGYDIASKGESFMAGLQEIVLSNAYIKSQLKVFEINEADVVLAISEDEAKEYYEKNIDELEEDSITELDLDTQGMWYITEEQEDVEKLQKGIDLQHNPTQFGDLMWLEGYPHKFMPYRKFIELLGEYKGPEIIASTEY